MPVLGSRKISALGKLSHAVSPPTMYGVYLTAIFLRRVEVPNSRTKKLEARVGFEPTNGGFADLSLGPLGYRAKAVIITKLGNPPGRPDSLLRAKIPSFSRLLRGPSLPAKTAPTLPVASD